MTQLKIWGTAFVFLTGILGAKPLYAGQCSAEIISLSAIKLTCQASGTAIHDDGLMGMFIYHNTTLHASAVNSEASIVMSRADNKLKGDFINKAVRPAFPYYVRLDEGPYPSNPLKYFNQSGSCMYTPSNDKWHQSIYGGAQRRYYVSDIYGQPISLATLQEAVNRMNAATGY